MDQKGCQRTDEARATGSDLQTILALCALMLGAHGTQAQGAAPSDAAIVVTANQVNIDAGELASRDRCAFDSQCENGELIWPCSGSRRPLSSFTSRTRSVGQSVSGICSSRHRGGSPAERMSL